VKTIGIIGTRSRDTHEDLLLVELAFLKIYEPGDRICSGLCPEGGDRFAVILVKKYNTPKLWFPPKWDDLDVLGTRIKYTKYGKPYNANAGFIRNTDIARESDELIACVALNRRGGTEDTIKKWLGFHPNGILILT
jgi:hypothetical protein